MLRFALIFCFLFICSSCYAQDTIPIPITKTEDKSELFVLDEAPIYPGCKRKKTDKKRKKCMSDKVSRFISKNYNVSIFEDLNLPNGKYTVTIIFKINKNGNVTEVNARGPHPLLEEEAVRVINSLPQIFPGKINGKPVIIPYAIPIYLSTSISNNKKRQPETLNYFEKFKK